MINRLKTTHKIIYLSTTKLRRTKIESIEEPYLYIAQDDIEETNGIIDLPVKNIGGNTLKIYSVEIEQDAQEWLKKHSGTTQAKLRPKSKHHIELKIDRKKKPKTDKSCTVNIRIKSNSVSDKFSSVQVNIPPPKKTPYIELPNLFDFGEIPVVKLCIDGMKELFLLGNFSDTLPKKLTLKKEGEKITVNLFLDEEKHQYNFNLDSQGIILPENQMSLKNIKRALTVSNPASVSFSGIVKTVPSDSFLLTPSECKIESYGEKKLWLRIKPSKMQTGLNFSSLEFHSSKNPKKKWRVGIYAMVVVKSIIGTNGELKIDKDAKKQEFTIKLDNTSTQFKIHLDYGDFPLFEDVKFCLNDVSASSVFLTGDFNNWEHRTIKLERDGDVFTATLSLPDGEYLYHYEFDGDLRLDPYRTNKIIVSDHGLCSQLIVKRRTRTLLIKNRSNQCLKGKVVSTTDWLSVNKKKIEIPKGKSTKLALTINPSLMNIGLNWGMLEIIPKASSNLKHQIPVRVRMYVDGVVPICRQTEFKLGEFDKGEKLRKTIQIKLIGSGKLKGQITPSNVVQLSSGELQIENSDAWRPKTVKPSLTIDTKKLSESKTEIFNAFLITNCYIANRRIIKLSYHYEQMKSLRLSPSVIFKKSFLNDAKQLIIVDIHHNSNSSIPLKVNIPKTLQDFLTASDASFTDRCEFIFDPKFYTYMKIKEPVRIADLIQIYDEDSGLSEELPFEAKIITSKAEVKLDSRPADTAFEDRPAVLKNPKTDGIPLIISNVGDDALKIHSISFEKNYFKCIPMLSVPIIIPPGHKFRGKLMANLNSKPLFSKEIEDNLFIVSNDINQPKRSLPVKATLTGKLRKALVYPMLGFY